MESSNSSVPTLRAALLCFVSDILATRTVCGFPNFNAKFGCSKCIKCFPCERFSGPIDYSGYDRQLEGKNTTRSQECTTKDTKKQYINRTKASAKGLWSTLL